MSGRPQKLIAQPLLEEIFVKYEDGMKVATLVKKYELKLSSVSLARLLKYYDLARALEKDNVFYKSLFPAWVDPNSLEAQVQPCKEWQYVGSPPTGRWEQASK